MTTYARKVDANQQEIINALRKAGALVLDLHRVGQGVPDLLVAYHDRLVMLEVKSARGRMTPDELDFADIWGEHIHVVHSPEEALRVMGCAYVSDGREPGACDLCGWFPCQCKNIYD